VKQVSRKHFKGLFVALYQYEALAFSARGFALFLKIITVAV
jgi:hypothetical protein